MAASGPQDPGESQHNTPLFKINPKDVDKYDWRRKQTMRSWWLRAEGALIYIGAHRAVTKGPPRYARVVQAYRHMHDPKTDAGTRKLMEWAVHALP